MKKDKEEDYSGFIFIGAIVGMVITHLNYPWMPKDGFDLVLKILGLVIFGGVTGGLVGYYIGRIFR